MGRDKTQKVPNECRHCGGTGLKDGTSCGPCGGTGIIWTR
jgi:DnaJ-class molecular chaperone